MKVVDLYRLHINPNPDGAEIHNFMRRFDLDSIYVPHYNEKIREEEWLHKVKMYNMAKEWIIKNSKL